MQKERLLVFTLVLLPFLAFNQCYNLVWEDDFSGTSLNTANWSFQTGAGIYILQLWTKESSIKQFIKFQKKN